MSNTGSCARCGRVDALVNVKHETVDGTMIIPSCSNCVEEVRHPKPSPLPDPHGNSEPIDPGSNRG